MSEITVRIEGLDRWERAWRRAPQQAAEELRRAMESAVLVTEAEVVRRTPVDLGRLRNGIAARVEGGGIAITGVVEVANVPYAPFVEWGTGIHTEFPGAVKRHIVIEPRTKRALRFRGASGQFILRRRVRSPGMRPQRMFRDGLQTALPQVVRLFERHLERLTRRIASGS